jgi:lipoprotein-anchoring transpeptidase ErfK/SrfK
MSPATFIRNLALAAVVALPALAPDASSAARRGDPADSFAPARASILRGRPMAARYRRKIVRYPTAEVPGTIVIDTDDHYLYYVLGRGRAVRYGIGVGREGFGWSGTVKVGRKAEWPTWTPPAEMIAREPRLTRYAAGMPGGPGNPLGARALYLYQGGRDTLFRIHGTNEPWTIGQNVSSGCIRMQNKDVVDLFERAEIGAKVVVR